MDEDRKDDAKPQDQAAEKRPLDDKTSKAQEDAAKERAEKGGYQ
ncbi:MAG TPA: hypothetical protein VD860_00165 [Azospirillum sp.]|nr:hypothetical protein [Azospirillum sp.]